MKVCVVGDLVTVRGLGFAGIEGYVVQSAAEARNIIKELIASGDNGLILVGQTIANLLGMEFDEYKIRKELPLIINIPDSLGAGRETDDIEALIGKALGIKV